jgi:hypothetical protein
MASSALTPETEDIHRLLADLYELLEDYAPPWYSEELHNRLLAELKKFELRK